MSGMIVFSLVPTIRLLSLTHADLLEPFLREGVGLAPLSIRLEDSIVVVRELFIEAGSRVPVHRLFLRPPEVCRRLFCR